MNMHNYPYYNLMIMENAVHNVIIAFLKNQIMYKFFLKIVTLIKILTIGNYKIALYSSVIGVFLV